MGNLLSVCFRNKRHEYDDLRQEFDAADFDFPIRDSPGINRTVERSGPNTVHEFQDTIVVRMFAFRSFSHLFSCR